MPQSILPPLLKTLRIPFSQRAEQELNHAPQSSFEALTLVLDSFKINSMAVRLQASQLAEVDFPVIVQLQEPTQTCFAFIEKLENETVQFFQEDSGTKTLSLAAFADVWTGNTLLLATTENSAEYNYEANSKAERTQTLQQNLALGAFVLFGVCLLAQVHAWQTGLWLLLQFMGLGISVLLLINEFGEPNEFIQKICHLNKKTDCNTVLQSDASKILPWLSWSELSFIYFFGTALGYTINPNGLFLYGVVSCLVLPVTLVSIYYQWRVLKTWCMLCLGIVAVLWFSAGLLFSIFNFSITSFFNSSIFPCFMGYLLAIGLWFLVKPFVLSVSKVKMKEQELRRFQVNTELFKAYLEKQRTVSVETWEDEIIFGNPDSSLSVIITSNPFCSPCAVAHKELMEWGKYYGAKIIYRFTPNQSQKDDEANKFIKHLCSIADAETQEHALTDWYETKKYAIWAEKYPAEIAADADIQLQRYANWVEDAQITQTPTIFMNGYELVEPYNHTQLRYLLRALMEE